jgi:hypothetical protein
VQAQKPEVTISLNEAFFDSLLDSVFQNFDPPEFSMAGRDLDLRDAETRSKIDFLGVSYSAFVHTGVSRSLNAENGQCVESVKILREMRGVRTAVRFRDGKIVLPLAFSGNYAPPFLGCVEFAGWAESNLDLEFDQGTQRLVGRVRVNSVNLNGTGGIGGSVIAKLIQGSIDKKMNPIEILSLDKVSFGLPVQRSGTLKMRAHRIKPEVGNGVLYVRVEYDFVKG